MSSHLHSIPADLGMKLALGVIVKDLKEGSLPHIHGVRVGDEICQVGPEAGDGLYVWEWRSISTSAWCHRKILSSKNFITAAHAKRRQNFLGCSKFS